MMQSMGSLASMPSKEKEVSATTIRSGSPAQTLSVQVSVHITSSFYMEQPGEMGCAKDSPLPS